MRIRRNGWQADATRFLKRDEATNFSVALWSSCYTDSVEHVS